MKDDLYEIGNRLYDHESDPPADGWKKIATAIKTQKPSATSGWRNRGLWVTLALIIGISFYFILPGKQEQGVVIGESGSADTVNKTRALRPIYQHSTSGKGEISNLPSANKEREQNFDSRIIASNKNTTTIIPRDASSNDATKSPELPVPSVKAEYDLHASAVSESGTQHDVADAPPTREPGVQEKRDVDDLQITAIRQEDDSDRMRSLSRDTEKKPEGTRQITVLSTTNEDIVALPDSAAVRPIANESQEADGKRDETEKETKAHGWRINFLFTPNYVARSLKPIANDEVFVTKMQSDDGSLRQRIALGFAIGAGKAITKDLYIDAHLTFSQAKQNTLFSYSTGNVDTLLAVQQPDQSFRLIPVYTESHREMKSRYTYGGLRMAVTYYFLSAPRRRFNLLAAAGINYLLSADVSERVDGKWIVLPDNDLNKLNYTVTVGAGYSMDLNNRWALMINPVLTYNLRQAKSGDLPYQLNQRPFGVNVMLSRRLGKL